MATQLLTKRQLHVYTVCQGESISMSGGLYVAETTGVLNRASVHALLNNGMLRMEGNAVVVTAQKAPAKKIAPEAIPQGPRLVTIDDLIDRRKGKSNKRTADKIRRQGFSAVLPVVKMMGGKCQLMTGHAIVEAYHEGGISEIHVFVATAPDSISAIEQEIAEKAARARQLSITRKRAWEIAREMAGGSKGSRAFYKVAYAQAKAEAANA